MNHIQAERVNKLTYVIKHHQDRVRDIINVRAEAFLELAKMQGSRIMAPNPQQMQDLFRKGQELDMEIKRLSDMILGGFTLAYVTLHPEILENLTQFKKNEELAFQYVTVTGFSAPAEDQAEQLIANALFRELHGYLKVLYPHVDIVASVIEAYGAHKKLTGEYGGGLPTV